MADLKDRLSAARDQAAAEVDRLRVVVEKDLPAALARLKEFDAVIAKVTPELEEGFVLLKAAGVRFDN